ncbi:hypothetical protein GCM10022215_24250 [Nocardioides fonticola]|uniref:Uncharacterized protein n=1 Tax=Nocardioides fonticola TaxID=450363 RepID=A0ABP7XJV9_9ACTN
MAQPSLQQARSHRATQAAIAGAAAREVSQRIAARRSWSEILTLWASYQLAAARAAVQTMEAWSGRPATANPAALAGVSSLGFPIAEPLIATIDRVAPAPAEPLPQAWWDDAAVFLASVEQLIAAEVQDAGRTAASVEMVTWPRPQKYVRVLQPPSCKRCVVLAGRIYRDLEAFDRHPGCDCQNVPVDSLDAALEEGLVVDPMILIEGGLVRDLSVADRQAILDGADTSQVINATRGLSQPGITAAITTEVFGRRVKATTDGTTKRAAWRRKNPTRLVRLRPESIYRFAESRADAQRLLKLYGYIL